MAPELRSTLVLMSCSHVSRQLRPRLDELSADVAGGDIPLRADREGVALAGVTAAGRGDIVFFNISVDVREDHRRRVSDAQLEAIAVAFPPAAPAAIPVIAEAEHVVVGL